MLVIAQKIIDYFKGFKTRFLQVLTAELSVNKIALTLSLGIIIGLVPFFLGASVGLSMLAAWRLKLNHALIQLTSNMLYPLQIILFVPFLKLGGELFASSNLELSATYIMIVFQEDFIGGLKVFGLYNMYALLLWLIIAVIGIPTLFYISKSLLIRFKRTSKNRIPA